MNMQKNAGAFIIAAALMLGAGVVIGRVTMEPIQPHEGEVLISEGLATPLDIQRPTALSVIMKKDDQTGARCLDMGGWLEQNICRNVDY